MLSVVVWWLSLAVPAADPGTPLALVHVTLIDGSGSAPQTDMTVIIEDQLVVRLGKRDAIAIPERARVIDGTGSFVIPGLWDMHVHLSSTTESALPALLANGVTTVRDMGGRLGEIDRWRAEIAAGARPGPRIFRAGPTLNGQEPTSLHLKVGSAEEARMVVRTLKKIGVDFVKIHNGVPREAYFALADEAALQNIPFVGHIPKSIAPIEACGAGQSSIEHAETLFEGTFASQVRPEQLADATTRFVRDEAGPVIEAMVEHGTFFTPMLVAYRSFAHQPAPDPRDKYVARSVRAQTDTRTIAPQALAGRQQILTEFVKLTGKIHAAGVPVLAGTDIGPPGLYPGFSLHDELALLVQGGLTPLEALRSATQNPAQLMAHPELSGSIEPGKIADLVLLDADPSVDIRNAGRIRAVIAAGNWYDRSALDDLLRQSEAAAADH